ncbi:MAG: HAD family hydrolase [Natronomonas sp.]
MDPKTTSQTAPFDGPIAGADPEYDVWVFDLDGTLVDVERSYVFDVFDRVGDRIGHEFTAGEIEAVWHGFGGPRNERLREWGIDPDRFWRVFHEVEDPTARAEATYLYDDAAVVAEIEAPTAVVTHCQQYLTDPVLRSVGAADWFDAVVCCTEDTGWKPDPTPVQQALDAIDADPDASGVLVGDSPHDIGAAWNAGLDAAHVERHGPERRGLCVVSDHRLSRVDELCPVA